MVLFFLYQGLSVLNHTKPNLFCARDSERLYKIPGGPLGCGADGHDHRRPNPWLLHRHTQTHCQVVQRHANLTNKREITNFQERIDTKQKIIIYRETLIGSRWLLLESTDVLYTKLIGTWSNSIMSLLRNGVLGNRIIQGMGEGELCENTGIVYSTQKYQVVKSNTNTVSCSLDMNK